MRHLSDRFQYPASEGQCQKPTQNMQPDLSPQIGWANGKEMDKGRG
jgi:hypothetical protein